MPSLQPVRPFVASPSRQLVAHPPPVWRHRCPQRLQISGPSSDKAHDWPCFLV